MLILQSMFIPHKTNTSNSSIASEHHVKVNYLQKPCIIVKSWANIHTVSTCLFFCLWNSVSCTQRMSNNFLCRQDWPWTSDPPCLSVPHARVTSMPQPACLFHHLTQHCDYFSGCCLVYCGLHSMAT